MRRVSQLLCRTSAGRRTARLAFVVALVLPVVSVPGSPAQEAAHSSAGQQSRQDAHNTQGLTPLIVAASAGQTEAVRALLAQGASVDAVSADGRTALIAAVQSGKIETVRALIAAGANLDRASRGTGTALNVAENTGKPQIAALLLTAGARTTGKSVGDTVCVRPWGGDGFCGTVRSFNVRSVEIQVTGIVGCANGCTAREECSASKQVGGNGGLRAGDKIAVPSWCLTQTGVKP